MGERLELATSVAKKDAGEQVSSGSSIKVVLCLHLKETGLVKWQSMRGGGLTFSQEDGELDKR